MTAVAGRCNADDFLCAPFLCLVVFCFSTSTKLGNHVAAGGGGEEVEEVEEGGVGCRAVLVRVSVCVCKTPRCNVIRGRFADTGAF